MTAVELFLFGAAVLLILCVLASKATGRLGVPTLVVFLGVGILAGSEGVGGIHFDNAPIAQTLGIVALAFILFSGGLDTKVSSIRPVMKAGISLASLGVVVSCLLVAMFCHYALDFTWLEGFLVGAIISPTDAGAVFTVLRARSIHLRGNLRPLLELESGSNDPMAVFLTITALQFMLIEDKSLIQVLPSLLHQLILGAGVGYFAGKGVAMGFNRLKLEFEGLYMVLSLAVVLIIYTTSQALQGSGFLAVYVAGVVLGNDSFVFKKTLILLHDGISWLMQSSMLLTLGLLIYPSEVVSVSGPGIFLGAFMILIARPASVFVALSFSRMNWREKALISWVGLRGAVPVVMATFPLVAGIGRAEMIFNLVFFVALTSLLIQGTTIPRVARWLQVEAPAPATPELQMEYTSTADRNNMVYVNVPEGSVAHRKSIVDMKFPQDLLIVLIERQGQVIIPRGATELAERDRLLVLAEKPTLKELQDKIYQKAPVEESSVPVTES
jgi:cell volume regulation protein A